MTDFFTNSPQGIPVRASNSPLIHQSCVTLTDSQIRALPSAVLNFTGKPGANRIIAPMHAYLRFKWFANYVVDPTAKMLFCIGDIVAFNSLYEEFGDQVSSLIAIDSSSHAWIGIKGQVTDSILTSLSTISWIGDATDENVMNRSFLLETHNGGVNFTGGDPSNILQIGTAFMVFDVSLGRFITVEESGWNEGTKEFY